jgi:uncharacterized membrane protein
MNKESVLKFLAALGLGLAGYFTAATFTGSSHFSLLAGWDLFALTYIAVSVAVFLRIPQEKIRERCSDEDLRSWLLFLLVIIACMAGLVTVTSLLGSREEWNVPSWLGSLVGIGAIAVSWIMVHTSFTFRYAHLYYGDDNRKFAQHARGLTFPEDEEPDYFDFAYFSFVIGMTFQVSDIVITAKGVRRLALVHSLIAFVFNTVVIALTISEIVSMHD